MTTASELDRPIEIQSKATVLDGAGQEVETWTTAWKPSARVRPFGGSERFTAQQIVGKAVVTFKIRYRPGVAVDTHRIVFDGRTYDLHDVREVGRQEALEIDASTRSEA